MPCLCVKCHEPCNCDELLCSRCLMDAIREPTSSELYAKENEQVKERSEKSASALANGSNKKGN